MPARDDTPQPTAPSMTSSAARTLSFAARLSTPRGIVAPRASALQRSAARTLSTRLMRRFAASGTFARTANLGITRGIHAQRSFIWLATRQQQHGLGEDAVPRDDAAAPQWGNAAAPLRGARAPMQRAPLMRRGRAVPPLNATQTLLHRVALLPSPQANAALTLLQRAPFVPPQTSTQPPPGSILHRAGSATPLLSRVSNRAAPIAQSRLRRADAALLQHPTASVLHRAVAMTPWLHGATDATPLLQRILHTADSHSQSTPSPSYAAELLLLQRAPRVSQVPPQASIQQPIASALHRAAVATPLLSRVSNRAESTIQSAPSQANTALPLIQRVPIVSLQQMSVAPLQHPATIVLHRSVIATPLLQRTSAPAGQVVQLALTHGHAALPLLQRVSLVPLQALIQRATAPMLHRAVAPTSWLRRASHFVAAATLSASPLVPPQPSTQHATASVLHRSAAATMPLLNHAPNHIALAVRSGPRRANVALPQHPTASVLHRATGAMPLFSSAMNRAETLLPLLQRTPAPADQVIQSAPQQARAAQPTVQRAPLIGVANSASQPAAIVRTAAMPRVALVQPFRSATLMRLWHATPAAHGATNRAETLLSLLRAVHAAPTADAPQAAFAATTLPPVARADQSARYRTQPFGAAMRLMRQMSPLAVQQERQQASGGYTAPAPGMLAADATQHVARAQLMPGTARANRRGQLQRLRHAVTPQVATTAPVAWQPVLLPFVRRNAAPAADQQRAPVQRADVRGGQAPSSAAFTRSASNQRRANSIRQPPQAPAPRAAPQPQPSRASSALVTRQPTTFMPAALLRHGSDFVPGAPFAAALAQRSLANAGVQRQSIVVPKSAIGMHAGMAAKQGAGAPSAPFVNAVMRRFASDSHAPVARVPVQPDLAQTTVQRQPPVTPHRALAKVPLQHGGSLDAPFLRTVARRVADDSRAPAAPGVQRSPADHAQATHAGATLAAVQRTGLAVAPHSAARTAGMLHLANRAAPGAGTAGLAPRQVQRALMLMRDPVAPWLARSAQAQPRGDIGMAHSTMLDLVQPRRQAVAAHAESRPTGLALPSQAQRTPTASRSGGATGSSPSRIAHSNAVQVAQRTPSRGILQPRHASGVAMPVQRTQPPAPLTVLRQIGAQWSGGAVADRSNVAAASQPMFALHQPQRGNAPTAFAPTSHSAPLISRAASDTDRLARTTRPRPEQDTAAGSSTPTSGLQPTPARRAASLIQPWRAARAAAAPFMQRQTLVVQRHVVANQLGMGRHYSLPRRADAALMLVQPWRSAQSSASVASFTQGDARAQQPAARPVQRSASTPARPSETSRAAPTRSPQTLGQPIPSMLRRQFAVQQMSLAADGKAVQRSSGPRSMLTQRRSAAPASPRAAALHPSQPSRISAPLLQPRRVATHAAAAQRAAVQRTAAQVNAGVPLLFRASGGNRSAVGRFAASPGMPLGGQQPTPRNGQLPSLRRAARAPEASRRSFSPAVLPLMQRQFTAETGATQRRQPEAQGRSFSLASLSLMQRQSHIGAAQPEQAQMLRRTAFQPAILSDVRVFTQPAATNEPSVDGSVAAVQRNGDGLALPHVQRAPQAARAPGGTVQRMDAAPAPLSFVQRSAQAAAPRNYDSNQAGPVGTVLQRVQRMDAHADLPRDLLRPVTARAPEQAAPIQRQEQSIREAQTQQDAADNEIDIEALAQEIYARLRRRLAVEAERIGRR